MVEGLGGCPTADATRCAGHGHRPQRHVPSVPGRRVPCPVRETQPHSPSTSHPATCSSQTARCSATTISATGALCAASIERSQEQPSTLDAHCRRNLGIADVHLLRGHLQRRVQLWQPIPKTGIRSSTGTCQAERSSDNSVHVSINYQRDSEGGRHVGIPPEV